MRGRHNTRLNSSCDNQSKPHSLFYLWYLATLKCLKAELLDAFKPSDQSEWRVTFGTVFSSASREQLIFIYFSLPWNQPADTWNEPGLVIHHNRLSVCFYCSQTYIVNGCLYLLCSVNRNKTGSKKNKNTETDKLITVMDYPCCLPRHCLPNSVSWMWWSFDMSHYCPTTQRQHAQKQVLYSKL